jgi:hypothetical protein
VQEYSFKLAPLLQIIQNSKRNSKTKNKNNSPGPTKNFPEMKNLWKYRFQSIHGLFPPLQVMIPPLKALQCLVVRPYLGFMTIQGYSPMATTLASTCSRDQNSIVVNNAIALSKNIK